MPAGDDTYPSQITETCQGSSLPACLTITSKANLYSACLLPVSCYQYNTSAIELLAIANMQNTLRLYLVLVIVIGQIGELVVACRYIRSRRQSQAVREASLMAAGNMRSASLLVCP